MHGAERVEDGDGESEIRVDDFCDFEPLEGRGRLLIAMRWIIFEVVGENAVGDGVLIDMRKKRKRLGNVGFGRDYERGVQFFYFWGGDEEI